MKRSGSFVVLALLASTGCASSVVVDGDPGAVSQDGGEGGGSDAYRSRLTGPQPGMVAVQSPDGVTYYVDRTEVSQAAYDVFLKTNPPPDPSSRLCSSKKSFAPGDVAHIGNDPANCAPNTTYYDPIASGTLPVVCVDWCDAVAYCQWAGKRLCGRIGGGAATTADFAVATASQWYNACSNEGTTPFPYGTEFVHGACNLGPLVAPVGQTPGCHAAAAPLSGVFDMSGNVAEWEDACMPDPAYGNETDCLLRGGSFVPGGIWPPPPGPIANSVVAQTLCGATLDGQHYGMQLDKTIMGRQTTGFRCCAD